MEQNTFNTTLSGLTDSELVAQFNKEVGSSVWGTSRAIYIQALRDQFEARGIDYSVVGNQKILSFKNSIKLNEKRLEIVE